MPTKSRKASSANAAETSSFNESEKARIQKALADLKAEFDSEFEPFTTSYKAKTLPTIERNKAKRIMLRYQDKKKELKKELEELERRKLNDAGK